jgi:hypothetical protein
VERQDLSQLIAKAVKRGAPNWTEAIANTVAQAVIRDMDAANLRILGPDGRPIHIRNGSGERRRSPRARVLKQGTIIHSGGRSTMECIILDQSQTGALLRPSDILFCPQEFTLKPKLGPEKHCEAIWRDGSVLGVRFI